MDTAQFSWSAYGAMSSKGQGTSGVRKSSFSIEAILSRGSPEPIQRSMGTQWAPMHTAATASPMWPPAGYLTTNTPYPHFYMSYQPQDENSDVHYNNGYAASCGKLISRRNYVRRTCRRIRTIFTDEQLKKLEEVFSKQRYMTGTEKVLLASALQLSETQVKVWFQNRRTRWRKTQEDDDKTGGSTETSGTKQGASERDSGSWSP
ncbi:homeobox protein not2-like [Paramormyrops kingsleyae]|uniref:Homeobox protein not2-like n=1 Tax=Paramormyrops kingsleyae TaxID=1676925 RepID=A0A3B3SF87_9TELE|nr:homeobox protein not2-like [Paramormyrops kingsleyae]